MLNSDLDRYLEIKRAGGYDYRDPRRLLRSFVTFAEAGGDTFVRVERVLDWASRAPSPRARRDRLLTVRRFALAMRAEDGRHEVPAMDAFGRAPCPRRAPYIYTPDEISRLITAATRIGPPDSIRPLTCATLFGLLAATGLRISEALALKVTDLTEDGLLIRQTKFKKSRLVPLHETSRIAINSYLMRRVKQGAIDDSLFILDTGRAPAAVTIHGLFRRLARSIGLQAEGRQRQPRIHDLRHTFAVRSLEQCRHDRATVSNHTLALSTYLGHVSVKNTYWYLEATPVLMTQIADAGETLYRRGDV